MCSIQTLCVNVYILGHWEATKCCERQLRTKITDCNLSWFHSCFTLINCFLCLGLYIFKKKSVLILCESQTQASNLYFSNCWTGPCLAWQPDKNVVFKKQKNKNCQLFFCQSTSAQASIFTFSWSSPLVPSTVSPLLLSSCRDTQRENRKCLMSRSEEKTFVTKSLFFLLFYRWVC